MPELPEVQTIASQLEATVQGARIESVALHRPDFIRAGRRTIQNALPGRRFIGVERQGKRLTLRLDNGASLVVHLGMSGRVTIEQGEIAPAKHTHLRLSLSDARGELRFCDPRRFGGIWFLDSGPNARPDSLGPLGPDALSIRVPVLKEILTRRRQIKALLMDQHAISGLGNIYCDEALHRAGIHPLLRADQIPPQKVKALACSIRKILQAAVASGGSTFSDFKSADGSEGRYQKRHQVYGREGQPCHRCGLTIQRKQIAGRSTHFCARCQPSSRRVQKK